MNKTTEVFESKNSNYSSTSVERALKLAEEALQHYRIKWAGEDTTPAHTRKALAAIREALAERQDKPEECANGCPENMVCDYCQGAEPVKQEPVAEVVLREQRVGFGREEERKDIKFLSDVEVGTKLYAAPVDTKAIRALKLVYDNSTSHDWPEDIWNAIEEALAEQAPIQSWFGAGAAWPEKQEMISAAIGLSSWLSAALDDPKVCQEYKDAINAWFDAAMPAAPSHREINESIHERQYVIRKCVSLIREEMDNVPQLGATWLKLQRLIGEIEDMGDEPVKQEPVHEALQIASVALQDIACSSQTENLYWWQLRARKAQKQIAERLTIHAPVQPVKQEPVLAPFTKEQVERYATAFDKAFSDAGLKQEPVAFKFVRYVDGKEMAEGVTIEREKTLEAAIKKAVSLCPNRNKTVLVYAAPVDAEAIRSEALEEAAKVCESTYPTYESDQLPCFDTPADCAKAIRKLK